LGLVVSVLVKMAGRTEVSKEIQDLIRRIPRANPDWDSPRIVGESGKLGIEVAKLTVEKYRILK